MRDKDGALWTHFSRYIRLRDSDSNGNCKCITCGLVRHWKQMDCGHGIGRQHKATKYNEKNNHAQCKRCNGFEGGKREVYKEEVDRRYGVGTWATMEIMSKKTSKIGKFEKDILAKKYKELADELEKLK